MYLITWLFISYCVYVFLAESFSFLPPQKFSSRRHGHSAKKRKLGYWCFTSLVLGGLIAHLLVDDAGIVSRLKMSAAVGALLSLPGIAFFFITLKR